jgi:hypothetical protein
MLAKYFQQGRKAADGKRSPEQLHGFRIKTKKFRYTLELFRPVYGAELERVIQSLRDLQNVLGKLHDYHIIDGYLKHDDAAHAKIQRLTKKRLKEFHGLWATWDSKDALRQWEALLAAGRPKSKPVPSRKSPKRSSTRPGRAATALHADRPSGRV